jgi:hypothetical protein
MILGLDESLINQVREIINSSNIFYKSPEFEKKWNLLCAFMDRIEDTAVALNRLGYDTSVVWSTNKIVILFVYADIIKSGIEKMQKDFGLNHLFASGSSIFGRGNDDEFFKHLRNLVFAHTLETDRLSSFVIRGEEQYAPYLLDNPHHQESIYIKVYSNLRVDTEVEIVVDKKQIIEYVSFKYDSLIQIIKKLNTVVNDYGASWLEAKIEINENINLSIENLRREALNRFDDYTLGVLGDLNKLFSYTSEIHRNNEVVDEFRKYVEIQVYSFIECYNMRATVDNHPLYSIFHQSWKSDDGMSNYILEKITTYLTEDYAGENNFKFSPGNPKPEMRNVYIGFVQLGKFKEKLSDQYVDIDYNMSFNEIQILIQSALFIHNKQLGNSDLLISKQSL